MAQSVPDGATVPILYESRLPDLAVWGKRLDPLFEAEFPELNEEQKEKIKKQEVTARKIGEAPDRIEMIALDIVKHYQENFEVDGFKAQLAACSQKAAAEYFKQLDRLMPGRCALLLSDPAKHATELWDLKRKFADEEEIIRQFIEDGNDKLAILIVVDKYLTGFDAPIEKVLYLDKSLQEHNLLQAIARVNRPYPQKDKQWGLVVDYWGVAGFLDQALKGLHEDLADSPLMERRDGDDAFTTLRGRHTAAMDCFPEGISREGIDPWLLALEKEDLRAVFLGRYRSFYKALEQLLPDPRALDYLTDFAWLRRVRKELENFYQEEDLSIPDCSARVSELIARSVKGEQIIPLLKPVNILSPDFEKEMDKLLSDRAKALRMRHAVKHTINIRLNEDPALYESLQERLERIINDRKASRFDDIAEFKLLSDIAQEIKSQQDASGSQVVAAEARPFFHALVRAVDSRGDDACLAEGPSTDMLGDLATDILDSLRSQAVIDWRKKADAPGASRAAHPRAHGSRPRPPFVIKMTDSIQFGDSVIRYQLKKSASRKTLSISVANQTVEVAAPSSLSPDELKSHVTSKAGWILNKLDENSRIPPVYPRQMQSGETIHYLGKQYLLKVRNSQKQRTVKLWRGELIISLQKGDEVLIEGKKQIKKWYQNHLREKITPMIQVFSNQLKIDPAPYEIRELGTRWGSCGKNGRLYFHWQLARLPISKIQFVCAHEVVHLLEKNHTPQFHKLMSQLLPQQAGFTKLLSL